MKDIKIKCPKCNKNMTNVVRGKFELTVQKECLFCGFSYKKVKCNINNLYEATDKAIKLAI